MAKSTIFLSIRKPAQKAGIQSGKQLADRTGLAYESSYDLWNERSKRIDLKTLATLCDTFNCTIQTILKRSIEK